MAKILHISQTRCFQLPTCKVYASHCKNIRPNSGFHRKQPFPIVYMGLSYKNMVREWFSFQILCCPRFLELAHISCKTLKRCFPWWKSLIWYENLLSSLQWKCRAYLGKLLPIWQISHKCHKQEASIFLLAKCMHVTEKTPGLVVVSTCKQPYFPTRYTYIKTFTEWLSWQIICVQ